MLYNLENEIIILTVSKELENNLSHCPSLILQAHTTLVSANFRQSHMDVMVQQYGQYSIIKKHINRSLMLWTIDKLCNHGNQATPKQ